MNYEVYGIAIATWGLIYTMIRNFRKDVEQGFKEIHVDLTEVKERLSFLEAANIYTMPLEPSAPNPRSQAAKEMWQRRKAKKLGVKK